MFSFSKSSRKPSVTHYLGNFIVFSCLIYFYVLFLNMKKTHVAMIINIHTCGVIYEGLEMVSHLRTWLLLPFRAILQPHWTHLDGFLAVKVLRRLALEESLSFSG